MDKSVKKIIKSSLILMVFFGIFIISFSISRCSFDDAIVNTMVKEEDYRVYFSSDKGLSNEDVVAIKKDFNYPLTIGYTYYKDDLPITIEFNTSNKDSNYYNLHLINPVFYEVDDNFKYDIITGRLPSNSNEILISSYVADVMVNNGVYGESGLMTFKNINELINVVIKMGDANIMISGIYDLKIDEEDMINKANDSSMGALYNLFLKYSDSPFYVSSSFNNYIMNYTNGNTPYKVSHAYGNVSDKDEIKDIFAKYESSNNIKVFSSYSWLTNDINNKINSSLNINKYLSIGLFLLLVVVIYKVNNKKDYMVRIYSNGIGLLLAVILSYLLLSICNVIISKELLFYYHPFSVSLLGVLIILGIDILINLFLRKTR